MDQAQASSSIETDEQRRSVRASRRPRGSQAPPARPVRRARFLAAAFVLGVTALCMLAFIALLLRPAVDPGIRVWMLNHTPDQCIIINPYDGIVEKKFLVADGLRELAFSSDMSTAYIANVVDVSNRLTVLDTTTYLDKEVIEVDGVPQGIGVFPDNRHLAVILGSKTDFMAGGFDILDLKQQSKADPKRKLRVYRERELSLTHKIAVGDDGDRIYCIDAKDSKIFIFSVSQKRQIGIVELHGAAEELYYPRQGQYYYVSVLKHEAIYQIDKRSDRVVASYIYEIKDTSLPFQMGRLRFMAVDSKGKYLLGTSLEKKTVIIWRIDDPAHGVDWEDVPVGGPDSGDYVFEVPYFLPVSKFQLKGGYNPAESFVRGGKQIAVDPLDRYLYVVDELGKLYIYDMKTALAAPDGSTPEPHRLVTGIEGEMRDLKLSNPLLRSTGGGAG